MEHLTTNNRRLFVCTLKEQNLIEFTETKNRGVMSEDRIVPKHLEDILKEKWHERVQVYDKHYANDSQVYSQRIYEDGAIQMYELIKSENDSLKLRLKQSEDEAEKFRMQLAGCGVAAMQNTEASRADRIAKDNPYWCASYQDVCNAVDREIALRLRINKMHAGLLHLREAAQGVVKVAASNTCKPECHCSICCLEHALACTSDWSEETEELAEYKKQLGEL